MQDAELYQQAKNLAAFTSAIPPPKGTWSRSSCNVMSGEHVDGRRWLYCECRRTDGRYQRNLVFYRGGTTFVNMDGRLIAEEHDPVREALREVDSFEDRIRATMRVAARREAGGAAFPNFHQARAGSDVVFGVVFLSRDVCEHRDIPSAELGNPSTVEERFRAAYDYARRNDFGSGYPTFIDHVVRGERRYGVVLIRREAMERTDVPVSELNHPSDNLARFRNTHNYAHTNGFAGGIPNFHQARRDGQGVVHGTVLFKSGSAQREDVSVLELAGR